MAAITYELNILTGSIEPKRSAKEEAERLVKKGITTFDQALLLIKGERQR